VDRGFDPEDQPELIVPLDGRRSQARAEPGAFDAGIEAMAPFVLVVPVPLAAQEGGHVVGVDSV